MDLIIIKNNTLNNKNQKAETLLWRIVALFICSIACFLSSFSAFATSPNVEGIQVYQKNLAASPEHRQNLAEDVSRYQNADSLWDVLRDEFAMQHYESNPLVQEKIQWYMNNQDYLLRSASRAAPYMYYILQQVKKRHLPAELVLIPIIESGYNPFSVSPVGAAGIWQLMPGTASDLGIKRDSWYDGRRDVIASTRGALNHFAYLQTFFEGNWLYAIAAYDTGEGNLMAAIRRNIREGIDTDFWSLPVAQETRDYVPSLLALATILSNPNKYPIYFPPVRNAPYLAQVDVGTQINLKYAAFLAGISYQKLMQLNSGFKKSAIVTRGSYKLVLPIENVEQFSENLARSPLNSKIYWLHYKVKSGDTLALIAKKYNTDVASITKMNHLAKSGIHPGTNLLLPYDGKDSKKAIPASDDEKENDTNELASKAKSNDLFVPIPNNYTLQPGDTVYMVRSSDSLKSIASRFHLSPQMLQAANQLNSNKVPTGRQLIIPTHYITSQAANGSSTNNIKPGDTVYMIRNGDTIETIADKFHTSAAAIRVVNLMSNDNLQVGEKLVVPTHVRG